MKNNKQDKIEAELRSIILPLRVIMKSRLADTKTMKLDELADYIKVHNTLIRINELLEEQESVTSKYKEQKIPFK